MSLDGNALHCLQAQMTGFPPWQEDCRAASLLCQKLAHINSPLGTPYPDKAKEDLFRIPCKYSSIMMG